MKKLDLSGANLNLQLFEELCYQQCFLSSGKINVNYVHPAPPNFIRKLTPEQNYLYWYTVNRLGYCKPPVIMKDKAFASVKRSLPIGVVARKGKIFRGQSQIAYLEDMLTEQDYNLGIGIFGSGLYFDSSKDIASNYANFHDDQVMTAKLDPTIRIIKYSDLSSIYNCYRNYYPGSKDYSPEVDRLARQLYEAVNNMPSKAKELQNNLIQNPSLLAMLFGYEATFLEPDTLIIFNRGKILVSEKEYNRILAGAKEEQEEENNHK